jgi:8-oxo-dGTP diphosphatase
MPTHPRNPYLTVDIIIEIGDDIVMIERKNPPHGWALPGGFVEYGESVEAAALREAEEETGLQVELIDQFRVYSDPNRDPRQHNVSVVFIATAVGVPVGKDDAKNAIVCCPTKLPKPVVFDHEKIIKEYFEHCAFM